MPTAFLGLGALGHAFAGRLIATGTDLVVWNRTAARAADLARARPLLDRMGTTLFHWEEPGLATRMKLVNNQALGEIMAVLAEALKVGEAAGLDRARVLDVLAAGGGRARRAGFLGGRWDLRA